MKTKTRMAAIGLLACTTLYAAAEEQTDYSVDNEQAGVQPLDWRQWGGTSLRNNTPKGSGIPTLWDIDSGENVRWYAKLGSTSYGNPIVANGMVLIGTNNAGYCPRYPERTDIGCLVCLDEQSGKVLWQHSNEKLESGDMNDYSLQGVCSTPYVEGRRGWYVTNRCEVVCFDIDGFHDGEDDGPVTAERVRLFQIGKRDSEPVVAGLSSGMISDELKTALVNAEFPLADGASVKEEEAPRRYTTTVTRQGKDREIEIVIDSEGVSGFIHLTTDDKIEGDVVWKFDMMDQLGVFPRNMSNCSVTVAGDLLFVNTSNGVDDDEETIRAPEAPSFIALNKDSGKVVWTDNSSSANLLYGQWSSPAYAVIDGQPQVVFAGGDGWVYSFDPAGEAGSSKLLWKFDCNPKTTQWLDPTGRGDRNQIICTPVIWDDHVYVAVGQNPENGDGEGHLWCIDATKRGDISPDLVFNEKDLSTPIAPRRFQAADLDAGDIVKPNPNSGAAWHFDKDDRNGDGKIDFEEEMHRTCGSPAIKDGILYISDISGVFHCVDAKTGKSHWAYDMLSGCWASPLIVDGHVYIGDYDGELSVFVHSSDPEKAMDGGSPIQEIYMDDTIFSAPIVANNILYIGTSTRLYAFEQGAQYEAPDESGQP